MGQCVISAATHNNRANEIGAFRDVVVLWQRKYAAACRCRRTGAVNLSLDILQVTPPIELPTGAFTSFYTGARPPTWLLTTSFRNIVEWLCLISVHGIIWCFNIYQALLSLKYIS